MRSRPPSAGFTLIELMIVVAIIAIILAIAIPSLLAARIQSNETAVVQTLRTISSAQELFRARDHEKDGLQDYAVGLPELSGLIDQGLASTGRRYGYQFEMLTGNAHRWSCRATCLAVGRSGQNGFYVDDTGVIRICSDNFADATDPPIGG